MIPFNRASFIGNELRYLAQAIEQGHVSGNGAFTKEVEVRLQAVMLGRSALLTTSCTHALEMSGRLLNLDKDDEVMVPCFTFVSTASAFMANGARPVFVDVHPATFNVRPDLVEQAITSRTRAICIVHYAGVAAEPTEFRRIADKHGLALIEDNAHGLFGSFKGKPLGTFGDMSTLSFHETKNVTCGEGGALVVASDELRERAEILREKGTDRSRFLRGQVDKYTWVDVGSSWVMSDLLAGVLVGQLERVDEIQARRLAIWNRYASELADWASGLGVRLPSVPQGCVHPAHMFYLVMNSLDERSLFIEHLKSRGVLAVFHYQPLHLSKIGKDLGGQPGQHPVSEMAGNCLVRLPLFASLTDAELDQVISAVVEFA